MFQIVGVASAFIAIFQGYYVAVEWTRIFNSTFMTVYTCVVFYVWIEGDANEKFFFIAWCFNIFGFMTFSGVTSISLPATPITLVATPIGILLESLFFSFALANRIKSEQLSVIDADEKEMKYLSRYQSRFDHALVGMYKMEVSGRVVLVVSDGIDACDYCDKSLPDFVLMDINMPNRDGLEATKYLRGRGCTVPIYALTAETSKEEIDKALGAGCDGFLSKPLDRALLFSVLIENILHRYPSER
ncbi:MAG: response regulator [Pseudomonadales bacterium]|nr:response regulator [Pseudomonadales bacterium]